MKDIKEVYLAFKYSFEIAKLINNLKYKDYKKTVELLRLYADDCEFWDETKQSIYDVANELDTKFSTFNFYQRFMSNWFNIRF